MEPDIVEIRPGVYSVLVIGQSFVVHERTGADWVAVNSIKWPHGVADPRYRAKGGAGTASVPALPVARPSAWRNS